MIRVCVAMGAMLAVVACASEQRDETGSTERSAAPAVAPSGATARAVDYTCRSGRSATISVAIADAEHLAEVLNPIGVCEYDDGLAGVDLVIGCSGRAPARIHVDAVDGKLPSTTGSKLCGS